MLDFLKSYAVTGALWRLLRGAAAFAGGAGLTYLVGHVTQVPFDAATAGLIGTLLLGLDKFLREKGIISYN